MSDVHRPTSPTLHLTVLVLVAILIAIVAGASVAKTEIIARGQGRAVPVSRVQTVQPQTAGRIKGIEVRNGEAVERNQPLVRLAATDAEARLDALRLAYHREERRMGAAKAALVALDGDPMNAPSRAIELYQEAIGDDAHAVESSEPLQRDLMEAELEGLSDALRKLDADAERLERRSEALRAQVEALGAQKELTSVRLERASTLAASGSGTQAAVDEAESADRTLDRQIIAAEREVDEALAEADGLNVERDRLVSEVRRRQAELLEAAEAERARLKQDMRAAEQELADRTVRAPRAGRVAELAVFTVGGRVADGEKLMTIVPVDEAIEIEASVSNRDVGFVKAGQRAFLKFDAFPFERYGIVRGTVRQVASDARREEATGEWVYPVEVELDRPYVEAAGQRFPVQPGMTATIDVVTGERRYISYVFEPIIRAIEESFTER